MNLITKRSPLIKNLILSTVVLLGSGVVSAQTFYTAGPEALGEAGRATNVSVDSHFLNPAAMAFASNYSLGAVFQEGALNTDSPFNDYAVILTDNDPEKFVAGSLAYVIQRTSGPSAIVSDQDISVDLATKITEKISLGIQGRQWQRANSSGVGGFNKHNVTLGMLAVPRPWFGVALVAYDILPDDDLNMLTKFAIGFHFIIMDLVRIRADVSRQEKLNPNHAGVLNLGIEFDLSSGFLLRTGGIWDGVAQATYWTGGLSWEGPNLRLAYAFKDNVNSSAGITNTFQAWVNF